MNKPTTNSRTFNDTVRKLFKTFGGTQGVWYYNDAQHWRRNRRKVFKTYSGGDKTELLDIWKQVLKTLHDLGHTEWELFITSDKRKYCPRYVGIKKYEKNDLYR